MPVKIASGGYDDCVYIAIEGLDGSGGTTQIARLAAAWARRAPERAVVCTREPTDGPVGRLIRGELARGELGDAVFPWLFAADRRDHLDRVVLPALREGGVVLSDRCLLSSLAYQAPVLGLARVGAINADFRPPDLVVVLDLDVDRCLARVHARAARTGAVLDRFEDRRRLVEIAAAYDDAIGWAADRGWRIARVDGDGDPEAVGARVEHAVWPG